MTLPFQTTWPKQMGSLAGQPNFFVEKILKGLPGNHENYFPALCGNCRWKGMSSLCISHAIADTGDYSCTCPKCNMETVNEWAVLTLGDEGYYTHLNLHPKFHTIRPDPHNRWRPGTKIHFVINNRTKDRFQFAPVIEVKSVQEIEITRHGPLAEIPMTMKYHRVGMKVVIDGGLVDGYEMLEFLALNDGFNSVEDFLKYFNYDFSGKIIHWTDLKY